MNGRDQPDWEKNRALTHDPPRQYRFGDKIMRQINALGMMLSENAGPIFGFML